MNCNCGAPVRCTVDKNGKVCYVCPHHKCRFCALSPIQAEGWRRIVPPPPRKNASGVWTRADTVAILRFEALLHPVEKTMHFTVTPTAEVCNEVLGVLESQQFKPMWFVNRQAYIYRMEFYESLVGALGPFAPQKVQIEKIPPFFFRFLSNAQEKLDKRGNRVGAHRSPELNPDDAVYSQLKPFQKLGVEFIIKRGGRGMIADDMGLGKTVQAIAVAHHYRHEWPLLIICPLSLVQNWEKEIIRFCAIPTARIAVAHSAKDFCLSGVHSIVIVPYSSLKCLEKVTVKCNVVIVDESHYIKSSSAQRTVETMKLCRAAKRVLLLSGTPAMSRPVELFSQLQAFVSSSCMPTKTQFCARYCNSYQGRFSVDCTGHSNKSELRALMHQFVIRRTKAEVANELPSKSRSLVHLYISPKEKAALESGVKTLRESLKSGLSLPGLTDHTSPAASLSDNCGSPACPSPQSSLSQSKQLGILELRTATAKVKTTAVQDYVRVMAEKLEGTKEKVVIFAHHRVMMDAVRGAIEGAKSQNPLDYILITGSTPSAQRETSLDHFRTSPTCQLALLSMLVCGVGLNLTCATMVVFTELDWNPCTHLQCEDRVHRIGQSSPCFINYLLADGTSDTVIWPLLQNKLSVTTALLETHSTASGSISMSDCLDGENVNQQKAPRSDIPAIPHQTKGKQLTLVECKSGCTPKEGVPHERVPRTGTPISATDKGSQDDNCDMSRLLPQVSQATSEGDAPTFVDMATLQMQRSRGQLSPSASPVAFRGGQPAPIPVSEVSTSQAHDVPPASLSASNVNSSLRTATCGNSLLKTSVCEQTCVVAPLSVPKVQNRAAAAPPRNSTPAACEPDEPLLTTAGNSVLTHIPLKPASDSLVGGVKKTLFAFGSAAAGPASSIACERVGGTCEPVPLSNSGADDGSRLLCVPTLSQSEALRNYNSRRTRFVVGVAGEKRARSNEELGPSQ